MTGETVVNYIGNYDYYLEKREELTRIYAPETAKDNADKRDAGAESSEAQTTKDDWQTQKVKQARIRKIENQLKKTEERIAELEASIEQIDEECALPENATNSAKLGELSARQTSYREELENCYESWETLSEELEKEMRC